MTTRRERMMEDMRMRKLSSKAQDAYIRSVRQLAGFLGRPPDTSSRTRMDLRVLILPIGMRSIVRGTVEAANVRCELLIILRAELNPRALRGRCAWEVFA
jgi:hypothetical protein